jgi:threonine dehydratase
VTSSGAAGKEKRLESGGNRRESCNNKAGVTSDPLNAGTERSPMSLEDLGRLVLGAYERIRPLVLETPLEPVSDLFPEAGANVLFKREDLQQTGSFKLRGASNKILSLTPEEAAKGVITASNGNHGLGVAAAAKRAGVAAEVYVSAHVSPTKAQRIEQLGACLQRVGLDPLDAELAARAASQDSGKVFISPYNDLAVMAGQGTVGVEIEGQTPKLDAVFVAVGGGGLIGGIGAYLQWASPQTEVVGCWPENSPVLYESLKTGCIVSYPERPTLSESTAGGLEPDTITLEVGRKVIDTAVLVTEDEILEAMRRVRNAKGWLMEGAAGVALAGFLRTAERYKGKTVAVVICGGNVSSEVQKRV